jgi:hypothetical protein
MRIIEQINASLSKQYFIASIRPNFESGAFIVTFHVNNVLDNVDISSSEEASSISIPFSDFSEWSTFEQKIIDAKQASLSNTPTQLAADYQGFYSGLMISQIFAIARGVADSDPSALAAYTDFAIAITNCIQGNINLVALQVCLNQMLLKLPENTDLSEMGVLFTTYRIPLILPN